MLQSFTEIRRALGAVVTVLVSAVQCPSGDVPGRREVLAQVATAIETRTPPSPGSEVREYFACEPYQRIAAFEFVGASPLGRDSAAAIVQVSYEYLVSSTRIKDDLAAGIRAPAYFEYSSAHLSSPAYFSSAPVYWAAGTRYVVPGRFVFVRTASGWALR